MKMKLNLNPKDKWFAEFMKLLYMIILTNVLCGCAIHYKDAETGTEHIWGFSHIKMKIPPAKEGLKTVVTGVETCGLSIGSVDTESYFNLGWQDIRHINIYDENTAIRIESPDSDFFNYRIGSEFKTTRETSK